MAYEDFNGLPRRTVSDNILHDKVFDIAKNPKYDEYRKGLVSMLYKFFDKSSALLADKSTSSGGIKTENMLNQELAEKLHKPIIKKFEKTKLHSFFKHNNWGADLAKIRLICKFQK